MAHALEPIIASPLAYRREIVIWCGLTVAQSEAYADALSELIRDGECVQAPLQAIGRLRCICSFNGRAEVR